MAYFIDINICNNLCIYFYMQRVVTIEFSVSKCSRRGLFLINSTHNLNLFCEVEEIEITSDIHLYGLPREPSSRYT